MASNIGPHDQYALISPQDFTDRMEAHWSQKLELASSPALRGLWATMASTFRASIINSISGVVDAPWLILQPPTGSGKTEGACVFAAMQAEANAKGLLTPVGVLIVTRLIEQADALAERVNELAGRVVAVAQHSKRTGTSQELLDSDILIITHQAYVNAAEHLGSPKNTPHFLAWRGGHRFLTIIDEALANLVEESKVTMADVAQVLSYITPEMGHEFPEQLKVLEHQHSVLVDYANPQSRPNGRSTRMLWNDNKAGFRVPDAQLPDMDALRRAMKSLPYDTLVLGANYAGGREHIAEMVDDTIRSSQVVVEQWAYYSQKGTEHSINSSSLLIPLNVPGPVVLDATAHTNFMWDLFGPRAEIVSTPSGVRDYSTVRLHVARASGLGKGSMIENSKTRVPRVLEALQREVSPDSSVFMCMHKDTKPVALTYTPTFARFDVGHWGAIDGRNDWSEYDTAVIFGLPYRTRVWSTNLFFALRGYQDDYWFQYPDWNEHDDVHQVMEQRQLSVSIIQAINRVRCRRVVDAEGRSPSADIYIVLPKDQTGDIITQDILTDMPGIVEVPWAFELDGPVVPTVRRGSSHEALIAYMTTRLPGETAMAIIKSELGLNDGALKKLKEVLRTADHPTTTALRAMGVRYFVRGKGRGAKAYLMKDQVA
jgi:hypothetical protein